MIDHPDAETAVQRKTKIIATLGPAVASAEAIRELIDAGMNVARLNFSPGDFEAHRRFHTWVRQAAEDTGRPIAILQDIQGPRIRVGTFSGGSVTLESGDEIALTPGSGEGDNRTVYVENVDAADLVEGAPILMNDGLIVAEAISTSGGVVRARITEGGVLRDHKGVAFPGSRLNIPAVTAKDETDLEFGLELGVDFIASSFVSSGEDVRMVKRLTAGTPVIAKIESAVGFDYSLSRTF